jgi:hypothetical protein
MEILQICGKGFLSISQGVRGVYRNFLLNDESTYFWVSGDGWGYSSNWCRGAYCQHTSPDIEKYYEMCKSRRNSDQCYLLRITNKNNWDFDDYKEFQGYILLDYAAHTSADTSLINKIKSAYNSKVLEEKKHQKLLRKKAMDKKRPELAKKAVEKKRQELARKAAEKKKRQLLAKKAAAEKERQEIAEIKQK